jgi:hypothetical protein
VRTRTSCFSPLGIPWTISLRSNWGVTTPRSCARVIKLKKQTTNARPNLITLLIGILLPHSKALNESIAQIDHKLAVVGLNGRQGERYGLSPSDLGSRNPLRAVE